MKHTSTKWCSPSAKQLLEARKLNFRTKKKHTQRWILSSYVLKFNISQVEYTVHVYWYTDGHIKWAKIIKEYKKQHVQKHIDDSSTTIFILHFLQRIWKLLYKMYTSCIPCCKKKSFLCTLYHVSWQAVTVTEMWWLYSF